MKIQLAADSARFVLTLNADPGNVWRYNLSEASHNARNSRGALGGIIAPDCRAPYGRSLSYSVRATNRGTVNVAYPA